ncbi:carboxylesterase family protein [Aureobasidium pullulans]|uniref:Carboxylic ester hydrolase n=1 Tax=Aureobasidium pullulans TaxID=5580 RepID=A0AB74J2L9_AURPU|nr:carboxylesterase family protein [Aureobasidium pullulans]
MLSVICLLLGLDLVSSTPLASKHARSSTVHLDYATYQGAALDTGVTQYLGMRYASSPTGELRWRAPQDPPTIHRVQNATQFGALCVGIGESVNINRTEDCLFINVYTPNNATRSSKLPVWVYIPGGGYAKETNSNYNATEVIRASGQNVVFVNFNYRVSAYGFLASKKVREDGDLNVGLLDQRKALYWVKKYIAQFGGDPNHVVIHGVSAGAGSVGTHLTAYGGRDDKLFVGAIGQAPFFPCQNDISQSEWQFDRFASAVGCSNVSNQLACLRAQNLSTLQAANIPSPFPGQTITPLFYYLPVIDGDLIQEAPILQFERGKHIKVPLLVGDTTNEGSAFAANVSTPAEVSSFLAANCPRLPASALEEANKLYPLMSPLPRHAVYFPSASAATGESTFICPGLLMSESLSRGQRSKVWNYRFDVSTVDETAAGLGVPHTFDTPAIFGPYYQGPAVAASLSVQPFTTYNAPIVPIEMNYYISFVRTLNPNTFRAKDAPIWEPFEGKNGQQRLLFEINGTTMEAVPKAQQERCDFWYSLADIDGE